MVVALDIIPECYVDTTLVSVLLGGIGVNHQKSCNNVVAKMREKFDDEFAVGIIDNDKRRPGYLDEFNSVASSAHLQVLKHPDKHHFIITVSPASEGFVLSVVERAGLSMDAYGLPGDIVGLKKITKDIVSSKDVRLVNLFKDLRYLGECEILKNVLEYLMQMRYNARSEDLAALFK